MSKKLTLDKSTLSRLQAQQLTAIVGGTDGYESNVVDAGVNRLATNELAGEADSCCSKSCNRRETPQV